MTSVVANQRVDDYEDYGRELKRKTTGQLIAEFGGIRVIGA